MDAFASGRLPELFAATRIRIQGGFPDAKAAATADHWHRDRDEAVLMRVTIEIDPQAKPISGWLQNEQQPRQRFVGMIELMSLLEASRELCGVGAGDDASPPARTAGTARGQPPRR